MPDLTPGPAGDTLLTRFDTVAADRPAAVAVSTGHVRISYATLAEASRRLARRLDTCGRGRPGPVAVLREAGPGQICAALAAMRCGRPYLPVDPAYPRHRVEHILGDAAPVVVLGGSDAELDADGAAADAGALAASLLMEPGRQGVSEPVSAHDAYVMYTSGSSGPPKGVVIGHHSIVNLLDEFDVHRRLPPGSRHSACASPGFDASVWETWTSLTTGGELCVTPESHRWDATAFVDWLADQDIANAYVPAAFLPALAEATGLGIDLHMLRRVLVGAEPITRGILGAVKRALPGLTLLNAYGPTESTVCCLMYEVTAEDNGPEPAAIGTPIHGAELVLVPVPGLLDSDRSGEAGGELHVGGVPVGRYLHPEPGPVSAFYSRTDPGRPPRPFYRTGDLVRRDATGDYAFLGRIDGMLKVRGYRVAPREIEDLLMRLPGIAQAVVVKQATAGTPTTGREGLVAHIVASTGARPDAAEIQRHVGEQLPWYAVPYCVVRHEPLPLTHHGKIDRRALAEQTHRAGTAQSPKTGPPAETPLLRLWRSALGPAADPHASFLDNGGDSLTAGSLAAAVSGRTGRHVRMTDVLLAGSLEELHRIVDRRPPDHTSASGRRHAPLTPAQQGLLWDEQFWATEAAYAESCLFVLPRPVAVGRLHTAVYAAMREHPALGGRIEGATDPSRALLRLGARNPDLLTYRLDAAPADITALADHVRREPLNLETGPLGRARLIATPEGCVALLITVHHVVCDTWSLRLLVQDITRAFDGAAPPAGPPATACDYAVAEISALSRAAVARRATALARAVAGDRHEWFFLPPSPRVSTVRATLDTQMVRQVKAAAARHGVTTAAVMCAGFESALATVLGLGRFLYTTPVAHREKPDFDRVVGCLVNTVPVASSWSPAAPGDTGQFLTSVSRQITAALAASHLPYPDLLSGLRSRDVHQPPHRFLLVHDASQRLRLDGQESTGVPLPPVTARSEVYLSLVEDGERYGVHLHVHPALVPVATARSLLDAFEHALRTMTA